jgi:alanyl-tRNA synthetase
MGMGALEHYGKLLDSAAQISSLLSAKQSEIAPAVERLQEESASLRQKLAQARKEAFEAKVSTLPDGQQLLFLVEAPGLSPAELRQYCSFLCGKAKVAAIFSGDSSQGYKYAFGSSSVDIRSYGKALNAALQGRGGGAADLVQGSVAADAEKIQDFFRNLEIKE